jgi:hypothetical protein
MDAATAAAWIFRRYNITSAADQLDAARRLREYRATRPAESNVANSQAEHKSEHNSDAEPARVSRNFVVSANFGSGGPL